MKHLMKDLFLPAVFTVISVATPACAGTTQEPVVPQQHANTPAKMTATPTPLSSPTPVGTPVIIPVPTPLPATPQPPATASPTPTEIHYPVPSPTPAKPSYEDSLLDLAIYQRGDFLEIYAKEQRQRLVRVGLNVWQGNADIYPVAGGERVGHLWSQMLMFSPGNWLTDKVESEGLSFVSAEITTPNGRVVGYEGKWKFRNLFETEASHKLWADKNYTFHYVNATLEVKNDIDNVAAVWIELMNDTDVYDNVATRTKTGLEHVQIAGKTDRHYLDGLELDPEGWITVYKARNNQKGSAALVYLGSSHRVRPRWFDGETIDNIELHLLDPDTTRRLNAGERFELQYLVIVSDQPDDYSWLNDAVQKAKPVLTAFTR